MESKIKLYRNLKNLSLEVGNINFKKFICLLKLIGMPPQLINRFCIDVLLTIVSIINRAETTNKKGEISKKNPAIIKKNFN